jgi:hypothetical protein
MAGRRGTIYLLHFARPYRHARHSLGFAEDLERRLAQHRGARLVQVVLGAGIGFEVARTWDGDRRLERRLKNQRNAPARLCPICRGEPPDHQRTNTRRDPAQRAER